MTLSQVYERAGVHRLPVDPVAVAGLLGVKVVNYKDAADFFETDVRRLYLRFPLGFSFIWSNVAGIALNENSCGERRRRFTAAHELAHCVLGHLDGGKTPTPAEERAADRLAAELLAPLVVLSACKVRSSEEIARLCGLSRAAADVRLAQLAERERGGFSPSEDERRVAELFGEYIAATPFSQARSPDRSLPAMKYPRRLSCRRIL